MHTLHQQGSTNHEKKVWREAGEDEAYHGSISLGSALQTVCSPYIYQRMAILFYFIFRKVSKDIWTGTRDG